MSITEQALQFLSINSITEEGNEEIINYLVPKYESIGAKIVLQQVFHSIENQSKRQFNLIGILGDDLIHSKESHGLALLSHLDTPGPGNLSDWKKNNSKPLIPQIEGDEIIGLGAADAKLDFLCKLEACRNFSKMQLAEPLYLVATCGAESPVMGSKYLLQSKMINPKYVMVGAPSNLDIINSQKAKLLLGLHLSFISVSKDTQEYNTRIKISTKGTSAHAAHPELADNAISKIIALLRFLRESKISMKMFQMNAGTDMNKITDNAAINIVIPDLQLDDFRRKFKQYLSEHPRDYFELKFGGTGAEGIQLFPEEFLDAIFQIDEFIGSVQNTLKDMSNPEFNPPFSTVVINALSQEKNSISILLHLALLPESSAIEQRIDLEKHIQNGIEQIARKYQKLSCRFKRILFVPPLYTDESSTFIQTLIGALNRAGIDKKLRSSVISSEAAFFSEKGISTISFGPGQNIKNSHTANEFNNINQMEAAIRFYTQAIDSFCVRGV